MFGFHGPGHTGPGGKPYIRVISRCKFGPISKQITFLKSRKSAAYPPDQYGRVHETQAPDVQKRHVSTAHERDTTRRRLIPGMLTGHARILQNPRMSTTPCIYTAQSDITKNGRSHIWASKSATTRRSRCGRSNVLRG